MCYNDVIVTRWFITRALHSHTFSLLLTGTAVPLRDGSLSRTSLFAPRPLSRSSSIAFRGALASRIFFFRRGGSDQCEQP